ncbi:hypothetical protein EGT74_17715 [Chitinophaga lutea]|uniref:DUF5018 domain-containing protein n=1 Tax=Chitinophaga lutea TaxID=2488634 RepID=A0A3N4PJM5_9BACT|nr:hypothetical protein [Chitinophaga lutea]RPE08862.1 hypothetical protein EGT74_17715 [Chitinophaga lutea]
MKKYLLIILVAVTGLLSSCLKKGLDELPAFKGANITRFDFEYRWNDNGTFRVIRFNTAAPVVNGKTIAVTTTVPAAAGNFTAAVRNGVSAANIVGMCDVSTAASIKPVNGSPALGTPGDYSKPASYEVTAADGVTKNTWTLQLTLIK